MNWLQKCLNQRRKVKGFFASRATVTQSPQHGGTDTQATAESSSSLPEKLKIWILMGNKNLKCSQRQLRTFLEFCVLSLKVLCVK